MWLSQSREHTGIDRASQWIPPKRLPTHRGLSDGNGGLHVDDDAPILDGVQLLCGLVLVANGLGASLLYGSATDRRASSGRLGRAVDRMLKCPS